MSKSHVPVAGHSAGHRVCKGMSFWRDIWGVIYIYIIYIYTPPPPEAPPEGFVRTSLSEGLALPPYLVEAG